MGDEATSFRSDINAATDYLISSHQHEEMVKLTFPLLMLYASILLRYVDQNITSDKREQVRNMYTQLLYSISDTHRYLTNIRKRPNVRDDWPVPEYAEKIWHSTYLTSYMSSDEKGSRIYEKYSGLLIEICSEGKCEQAMTRFLDKGVYLKKDDVGHDQFSVFKHFIDYTNSVPVRMHNFTHDLYDTFIAGSVALLAYETLKNGIEGVQRIRNSIGDHMEGLNEELNSWVEGAKGGWSKKTQEYMHTLLSSKLNVVDIREACEIAMPDLRRFFYYANLYCLCYEMYVQYAGQPRQLWSEFRLNFVNYSNNAGNDMMVCFYLEEWHVEDNIISSSDLDSIQVWLQDIETDELEELVADNGLPPANQSSCSVYEMIKLNHFLRNSTLSLFNPDCIAEIVQLLFDRKWPAGNLFGVFVYKTTSETSWYVRPTTAASRRVCRTLPYYIHPYYTVCVFVRGIKSPIQTAEFSAKRRPFTLSQATSLIPKVSRACRDKMGNMGLVALFHLLVSFVVFFS